PTAFLSRMPRLARCQNLVSLAILVWKGWGMRQRKFIAIVFGLAAASLFPAASAQAFGIRPHQIERPASDIVLVAQRKQVAEKYKRRAVRFATSEKPGTIIVDTDNKFLYFVEGKNRATRYGIGVG